jgi:MFS family permease
MQTKVENDSENKVEFEKSLIKTSGNRLNTSKIAILFAIHMAALQQMSGVNAIVVYGKNTFEEALEGHATILQWATIGLFALSVISTLITIRLMNRLGRKTLMQIGTGVCTICLGVIGWSFYSKGSKPYN